MKINNTIKVGLFIVVTGVVFSCGTRRSEGRAYMPDMTYSRAYETYAPAQERLTASAKEKNETVPFYSGLPVPGTVARGDMLPYKFKNDSTGSALAAADINPLDAAAINMKESERLYLVNCGICHGTKLDGNGPLYGGGDGPFQAKPADLVGSKMTEGSMFYVATYGKGAMGSYASQLTTQQRWMVVAYIHSKKGATTGATMPADSTKTGAVPTTGAQDSTKVKG